ncbi:ABC transporter permease [Streptomyces sp. TP-A0874]|uniref:ABC transporter permease n=1 Tax=Streptomyces sp. TP-A0874 TaxID=549819 RepID=UPI0008538EA7|nr:ABC transporter permease [Streptomyces sp. TP-A0874]
MSAHTGLRPLLRLALRRDRLVAPAWVLSLGLLVVSGAATVAGLYDTPESRAGLAAGMATNASLRALYGPMFDPTSVGGLTAWRFSCFTATLAGLMAVLLVVRHTRDEEESGRLELLSAGAVGRRAPLAAGLASAAVAAAALGALVSVGLVVQGQPGAGALAMGASFTLTALVFAAVAAVAAQLTETGRAARSLAGGVLAVAFLLRAVGDAAVDGGPSWPVWLSPLGWAEQVRPFAGERWAVLLLPAALTIALVSLAYALVERRDLESGLLPSRPGRPRAADWLAGPSALAWRLQRGTLMGWGVGLAVAGLAFGAVSYGASDLVRDNEALADAFRRMGGAQRMDDAVLGSTLSLVAMLTAVYAVQAVLRMRSEETGDRAEPVLAGPVGRLRWAAGHLACAAGGSLVLLLAAGASMGLGYGAAAGDIGRHTWRLLTAALVLAPGVWFVASVAALLFGARPRLTSASWGLVGAFLLLGLYGPMLDLPQPVLDLSPFTHLPKVPAEEAAAAPLLALAVGAAVLTAAGLAAFRRRDVG